MSKFTFGGWLVGAIASLALATAHAGLELQPQEGVYIGEATPFRCIRFMDGGNVARFFPPDGWVFSADGTGCAFRPLGTTQASGTFTVRPKNESKPLADRMEALLREGVPAEAKEVACVLKGLPQVNLDEWKSIHVEATYLLYGQKFRIALVAAVVRNEELLTRFGCRDADFEKVFPPFLESLGTFTWEPANASKLSAGAGPEPK